jgi:hypothetical protein
MHHAISVPALISLLEALLAGITEFGCHPGVGTDDDFPYGFERSIEVTRLCNSRIREAIDAAGIDLRSYSELWKLLSRD